MRLLYITVTMPYGAAEPFFIPEVWEMLRQGCEVLIVPRSPARKCVNRDAAGLKKYSLRKPLLSLELLITALGVAFRHPLRTLRAFGLLFRSRNLLTLLKNLLVFPKALWLARLARNWGAEHIHAHWGSATSTMAMIASVISDIPWSFTLHRGDIFANNLLKLKIRKAALTRFIARDGIEIAESICGRPLPGRVVLLHLGVHLPPKAVFREEPAAPPCLLCAALLIERKGHKYLFAALRILRDKGVCVNLWIAGEGPLRPALESLVVEQGLDSQITFLGPVEHQKLLEMFQTGQVDAVVLPTLHEGIPVALMEPMGYGIPVISTHVGGIPELLRDGAGIMVPPADPVALADAIERVMRDGELRRQLSTAGRRRVEEEFSVERVVSELLQRMRTTA